jgi:hypothetical protein
MLFVSSSHVLHFHHIDDADVITSSLKTTILSPPSALTANMSQASNSIGLDKWPELEEFMYPHRLQARNELKQEDICHISLLFLAALEQHVDNPDFLYQPRHGTWCGKIRQKHVRDAFGKEVDEVCSFRKESMFLLLAPSDINLPVSFVWAWRSLMRSSVDLHQYYPVEGLAPGIAAWPKTQDKLKTMNQSDMATLKCPLNNHVYNLALSTFKSPARLYASDMAPGVLTLFKSVLQDAGWHKIFKVPHKSTSADSQENANERDPTDKRGRGQLTHPMAQFPTIVDLTDENCCADISRKRCFSIHDGSGDHKAEADPHRLAHATFPVAIPGQPVDQHDFEVPVSTVLRRIGRILERYGDDRDQLVASIGRYRRELEELEDHRRRMRSPT